MNPVPPKILIVEGRFYEDIGQELLLGATRALDAAGWAHDHLIVPGALEIPGVVKFAIRSNEVGSFDQRYAGFVSLGCVIRGETDHYDHVCRESIGSLMRLSLDYTFAHGCGILTVENRDQAKVRADTGGKDFGGRAAKACLRMIELKKHFKLG